MLRCEFQVRECERGEFECCALMSTIAGNDPQVGSSAGATVRSISAEAQQYARRRGGTTSSERVTQAQSVSDFSQTAYRMGPVSIASCAAARSLSSVHAAGALRAS